MRGIACPEAWAWWLLVGLPVPERVGSKALPILNKSLLTHRCQEEALSEEQEPPRIHAGEVSGLIFVRWYYEKRQVLHTGCI